MKKNILKIAFAVLLLSLSSVAFTKEIPKELIGTWTCDYYYSSSNECSVVITFKSDGTGNVKITNKKGDYFDNEDMNFYFVVGEDEWIYVSGIKADGAWSSYEKGSCIITGDLLITNAFGRSLMLKRKK